MNAHQRRVVTEKAELDEKLGKLRTFIKESPIFLTLGDWERQILRKQEAVMSEYSILLQVRIERFSQPA